MPETRVLTTEDRNPQTMEIDKVSALEMVGMFNREDFKAAEAVQARLAVIAQAVEAIAARLSEGGRLVYVGAGTSGRLGVLDAVECPPTFGTPPGMVVGVMAGGLHALGDPYEDVEDNVEAGAQEMAALGIGSKDCVVGIAASGRTPFVLSALQAARQAGALVISLACNDPAPIHELAQIKIALPVGPEALTGSTRLKSGTAEKMVLNMISTGVMIRLGKSFSNLMVDVQPQNQKLRQRSRRIVAQACRVDEARAAELLALCSEEVKTAIVVGLSGADPQKARQALLQCQGFTRQALSLLEAA
jgi:N-acetylmuramic acid 6-phosphate etherase